MTRRFHTQYLIPLALILLAALLRLPSLDTQSFWLDEVHAAYFTNGTLRQTAKLILAPEHNGPLYFLLLWAWRQVAGSSDFAIRSLSAAASLLSVAALWRLARDGFGRRIAGWAALLWAVSPFAIWFAQESKMYALHMLLTLVSTLLLQRALTRTDRTTPRRRNWPLWIAYGVAFNLLGYSHFFGGFIVAAQGIVVMATSLRRPARLRPYLLTMAVVALIYLPVISFVLRMLPAFEMRDISKGFVPLPAMLRELGSEYSLRASMLQVAHPWRLLVPLSALLLLGLTEAWWRNRHCALWLTALLTFPTLMFYVVSFKIPVFSPRYLSGSFPFFILTLALALGGLQRLWKPLTLAGLALMLCTAGWANARIAAQPAFQRSDWRAAARYLEQHATKDDVVVVFAYYASRALNRYYTGPAEVLSFKADPYQPDGYYLNLRDSGKRTLWLVLHQDDALAPHNRMRDAAGALFPAITGIYPNNGQIAVLGYSLNWASRELPADATPVAARFTNGLALVGYTADSTRLPAADVLLHPPSNWIHVTTYWQVWDAAPPLDFTPFVRMVDAAGGVWGGELQRPPTVFHYVPPENWQPGEIIAAHYDVNLNPITPPGNYRLIAGLELADGTRVLLEDGAREVILTPIQIVPR